MVDLLDSYNQRARLAPGLLLLAPVAITVLALGVHKQPFIAAAVSLLTAVGGAIVLASLMGEQGRRIEKVFRVSWGGFHTSTFLLHTSAERSAAQRRAWRADLERVCGATLRTAAEEAQDRQAAIDEYDLLIGQVRARTRDSATFPLVAEENQNYGFWRNLLGVKKFGVWLSGIGLGVCLALLLMRALSWTFVAELNWVSLALGVILCAIWLAGWLSVPSEARVRQAAERYAERLLEALTLL